MPPLLLLFILLSVAGLGLARCWLTASGAAAALVVGAAVGAAGWKPSAMLLLFFLAGSLATKYSARELRRAHRVEEIGSDAKRGRSALQVFATGGVPALLCLLQWWPAAPPQWRECYLAYLACCCGDTLASEFGLLAQQRPLLITTLAPVPAGRDGGVTLVGTLWSLAGGALVGLVGGPGLAARGALYGGVGSVLDSVLGALLQAPGRFPPSWHKVLNSMVNFLSSCLTLGLASAIDQLWPALLLVLSLLLLVLAVDARCCSVFMARKWLHLGTSVLLAASQQHVYLVRAVAATALLAYMPLHTWFRTFQDRSTSDVGIPAYAAAVFGGSWLPVPLVCALSPMLFSDVLAGMVGRLVPSPVIYGNKTILGTAVFFVTTLALLTGSIPALGLSHCAIPLSLPGLLLQAGALAVIELYTASWDNVFVALASIACYYYAAPAA